jgi:hypothetical protein
MPKSHTSTTCVHHRLYSHRHTYASQLVRVPLARTENPKPDKQHYCFVSPKLRIRMHFIFSQLAESRSVNHPHNQTPDHSNHCENLQADRQQ